jgi:outer membrane protein OmpA-like peptidoglycan-associated protein
MEGMKIMSSTVKILLGALATAVLAWFLHGPMKFGEKCAVAGQSAVAESPAIPPPVAAVPEVAAPIEAPATVEAVTTCQTGVDAVIKGKTINFTTGGSAIAPESQPLIDAVAASLKDCAGTTIEVGGHTDTTGADAPNQRLSEERANSVVQALVGKGVPAERLSPKGYGESKPLDPALNAAAHAKNRRIEFTVATTAAAAAAPAVN